MMAKLQLGHCAASRTVASCVQFFDLVSSSDLLITHDAATESVNSQVAQRL